MLILLNVCQLSMTCIILDACFPDSSDRQSNQSHFTSSLCLNCSTQPPLHLSVFPPDRPQEFNYHLTQRFCRKFNNQCQQRRMLPDFSPMYSWKCYRKWDEHFILENQMTFPPGVKRPEILFFSASQQQRRKAGFMIPWFTGSLMRATALSCLCGIKAASISAAVRVWELGIGRQRSDSSAPNNIHLLTGLDVVSWQLSEAQSGGRNGNRMILSKCN